MKKLSKIKLHEVPVLSENEMKMIFGGSGTDIQSSGADCAKAGAACDDKKEGDSCESGETCSPGHCKTMPFAGLVCWR